MSFRFRRRLLAPAAAGAVFLLSGCAAEEASEAKPAGKYRFILSNDGGSLAGPVLEAPIGVEGLVELAIEPLRDTRINTLFWQLGTDPYLGSPSHRLSDPLLSPDGGGPHLGDGEPFLSTAPGSGASGRTRNG